MFPRLSIKVLAPEGKEAYPQNVDCTILIQNKFIDISQPPVSTI